MKRKVKISAKRVVSNFLVFAMACQLVSSNNLMIANAESTNDTDIKSYIVMADNTKKFNDLSSRAVYSISEENQELTQNNIAVMELSEEEAEAMKENDDLIVEEDILITANALQSNLEAAIITESTETKTMFADRINLVEGENYVVPMYQDLTGHGTGIYPEYHGGVKTPDNVPVNFISCYMFLTKIALKGGDTSKFTNYKAVKGMDKRIFNKIKSKISTTKFGDLSWDQILSQYGNTKTNRKYFLYGVAIHLVSDSFAHRIRYKDNGVVGKFIKHPDADKTTVCANRLTVVREAVWWVLQCANVDVDGDYTDIAWALDKFNVTVQTCLNCYINSYSEKHTVSFNGIRILSNERNHMLYFYPCCYSQPCKKRSSVNSTHPFVLHSRKSRTSLVC